jgi:hypothetical protein
LTAVAAIERLHLAAIERLHLAAIERLHPAAIERLHLAAIERLHLAAIVATGGKAANGPTIGGRSVPERAAMYGRWLPARLRPCGGFLLRCGASWRSWRWRRSPALRH